MGCSILVIGRIVQRHIGLARPLRKLILKKNFNSGTAFCVPAARITDWPLHKALYVRRYIEHSVKASYLLSTVIFLFSLSSIGQENGLKLVLVSEQNNTEPSFDYKIRIDFISNQAEPVNFVYNPLFYIYCCPDGLTHIGIETEVLEISGYKLIEDCADCDPICCELPKLIAKTLNINDTISYRDVITTFKRRVTRKDNKYIPLGFIGSYRCRAWRIYTDKTGEHKIYSDWLYLDFTKP
jgi:hypothetical protein